LPRFGLRRTLRFSHDNGLDGHAGIDLLQIREVRHLFQALRDGRVINDVNAATHLEASVTVVAHVGAGHLGEFLLGDRCIVQHPPTVRPSTEIRVVI